MIVRIDPSAAEDRVRAHLVLAHGRTAAELDGLSAEDVHRFEHLEQAMGLLHLGHRHEPGPSTAGRGPGGTPAHRARLP